MYDQLLIKQNGVCAICRRQEQAIGPHGKLWGLAVDHEHASGRVRGLLCSSCNLGLGKLGNDPQRLRAAADYLEKS